MMRKLPTDLLAIACSFAGPVDLGRMMRSCKDLHSFLGSDETDTLVWRVVVAGLWSPLLAPAKGSTWKMAVSILERDTYPLLRSDGVKQALKSIFASGMAAPTSPWCSPLSLDIVRATLRYRSEIGSRRRVALFACSSDFVAPTTPPSLPPPRDGGDDGREYGG
jgi:hypothetical protein